MIERPISLTEFLRTDNCAPLSAYRMYLTEAVKELPNSFTEDFKAQVRTMDEDQFAALFDVLYRVNETLKTERHYEANPKTYGAHEVNRGSF